MIEPYVVSASEYAAQKHYLMCPGSAAVAHDAQLMFVLKDFLSLRFAFVGREPQRRYRAVQREVAKRNRAIRQARVRARASEPQEEA